MYKRKKLGYYKNIVLEWLRKFFLRAYYLGGIFNFMKKEKITVAQIASEAGVSPATVSRVFNHPDLVKKTTVRQVEQAMAALGCSIERQMFQDVHRQPLIVLSIPGIENAFYQNIIKGARTSATAHGCHLLIHESPLSRSSIGNFCDLLSQIEAAGVIILKCVAEDLLDQIRAIAPLVQCCEYNEDGNCPYVSIDDFSAAENATNYLLSCGCNKIALINGPQNFKYARQRQEGFLSALRKADVFIPQNWIVHLPEVNYEMAYAAICRLLNSETHPTAFFAISDIFAAACIRATKRFHLNVPRDIMVVGFDNIDFSMMTCPSITTVSQPAFQEGYSACELLMDMIDNPEITPKSLLLNTELIIRESTMKIEYLSE